MNTEYYDPALHPDIRDIRESGQTVRYMVYGGEYVRYAATIESARDYAKSILKDIYADIVNAQSFRDHESGNTATKWIDTPLRQITSSTVTKYTCVLYASVESCFINQREVAEEYQCTSIYVSLTDKA